VQASKATVNMSAPASRISSTISRLRTTVAVMSAEIPIEVSSRKRRITALESAKARWSWTMATQTRCMWPQSSFTRARMSSVS
jgi:hypothetical protein